MQRETETALSVKLTTCLFFNDFKDVPCFDIRLPYIQLQGLRSQVTGDKLTDSNQAGGAERLTPPSRGLQPGALEATSNNTFSRKSKCEIGPHLFNVKITKKIPWD